MCGGKRRRSCGNARENVIEREKLFVVEKFSVAPDKRTCRLRRLLRQEEENTQSRRKAAKGKEIPETVKRSSLPQ